MHLLEFELVVSVVAVAVVLDLVSTLDAHVLVVVLVRRVSSVVLVLGEIVVIVDPLRDCCFNGCDEDCGATCCFCGRRLCRWLLLCQILLSGYTMFGALIGIVSFCR